MQTGLAEHEMVTLTGNTGTTTIEMEFEFAGFPVVHGMPDVIWQATTSPFDGVHV